MPNTNVQTMAGAGTTESRRPTVAVVPEPAAANPELTERPCRLTFTAEEKQRPLQEADQPTGAGEIGAMLRREGLYSSALTDWRRRRDAGLLDGLTPLRRGPTASEPHTLTVELALPAGKVRASAYVANKNTPPSALVRLAALLGRQAAAECSRSAISPLTTDQEVRVPVDCDH